MACGRGPATESAANPHPPETFQWVGRRKGQGPAVALAPAIHQGAFVHFPLQFCADHWTGSKMLPARERTERVPRLRASLVSGLHQHPKTTRERRLVEAGSDDE